MSKILSFLLIFMAFAGPAKADVPWVSADQVRARLIPGDKGEAALEIELSPGWHSYWRVPGDAGLPPVFNWEKSTNVSGVDVSWPFPKRMDELGMTTFGYEGAVMFPLKINAAKDGGATDLKLGLDIMVCKDICIPQHLDLSLDNAAPQEGARIDFAKRRVPGDNGPGLSINTVVAGPDALVITVESARDFVLQDAFVTTIDTALNTKPEVTPVANNKHKAMITIAKPQDIADFPAWLAGKEVSVIVVSGNAAVEKIMKF